MSADFDNKENLVKDQESLQNTDLSFANSIKGAQEISREVELPGRSNSAKDEEAAIIDKVVSDVIHDIDPGSLRTASTSDDPVNDQLASKALLGENISAEIRETFGVGALRQESEAKMKAWNHTDINQLLEAEAKSKEKLGEEQKKSTTDPNKEEKGLIDQIIDKILQLLGLEPPAKETKNNKSKTSKEKGGKNKKELPIVKLLKALGLIER